MPDDQAAVADARQPPGLHRRGPRRLQRRQFHALVDDRKLANVVTLVARHGEIVNLDAYGVLDVSADPKPVQVDSIFRIASMTKPITGAAMMMLWEEGKWKLDDPVAKHIPAVRGAEGQAQGRRSGGADLADDDGAADEPHRRLRPRRRLRRGATLRAGDLQDMIDTLAKLPLSFQPGTDWRYGPSVDIQGYLIEQLSGQGLDEFFEQRLFAPLGMKDTGFWVDRGQGRRGSRASTSTTTTGKIARGRAGERLQHRRSRSSWPAAAAWFPRSRTTGASPR